MSNITPAIKKELREKLPDNVKIGDLLSLSTGDHARIETLEPDGRYSFSLINGPILSNDPKLNIPTGVDKLKNIQENNMANELDVTEVDRAKYEKIEKLKKRDEDVAAAINIAASLKDDIAKIKEELCEGPDCLKNQVQNKFGEMNNKFGEIDAKIEKLDSKTEFYACDKCGYDKVPALSSFCPQCGLRIPSWSDDNGQPVAGWEPYWQTHKEEQESEEE